MTYIDLLNLFFQAHREGDVVLKYIVLQQMDEVESDFADTLDAMEYTS
jgi:hypothetical protein